MFCFGFGFVFCFVAFYIIMLTKKKKKKKKMEQAKYEMSAERKAAQAAVDKAILAAIGKDKIMAKYLKARFTLTKGQAPHNLKF
jgi:large subunit ribosomal protein L6e